MPVSPPPPEKSNRWIWIGLGILFLVVVIASTILTIIFGRSSSSSSSSSSGGSSYHGGGTEISLGNSPVPSFPGLPPGTFPQGVWSPPSGSFLTLSSPGGGSPSSTTIINIANGRNVNAPVYLSGGTPLPFAATPIAASGVVGGFYLRDATSQNFLLYLPSLGAFIAVPTISGTLSNKDGSFVLSWGTPTLFVAVPGTGGWNFVFSYTGSATPLYLGWATISNTPTLGGSITPVPWTLSTCPTPTSSGCTVVNPSNVGAVVGGLWFGT